MSDSDSDSSADEDYIPEGEVASSDGQSSSENDDKIDTTTKKASNNSEEAEQNKAEKLKQLWESFKQETKSVVNQQPKPSVVSVTKTYDFAGEEVKVTETITANSSEKTKEQETSESGKVDVKKSVKRSGAGLGNVLQQMHKKPKISTLEKSKLDWNKFKKNEDIEDELALHSKDGFLEKQAFLQRTDIRQFEQEREVRLKNFKRFT
ncbi:craniofacial development protein 1-like [Dysidea avara]|uniref:craniofacial development protein 1-like n=1 Tax=Dysidea avara TaxID=196820 RepID=UPI00332090DA